MWWLVQPAFSGELPLTDRVEKMVVEVLQKSNGSSEEEVQHILCRAFPGLFTPSMEFIRACIESYGEELPGRPGYWLLHPREQPAARLGDLQSAREMLRRIGKGFGFESEGENPLLWKTGNGQPVRCFYLMGSSILSRFVYFSSPLPPDQCILVLPGSRSRLLALKLRNDPRLSETVAQGWGFLKLRHLRRLVERPNLNFALWESLLGEDPPLWEEARQINMFF